MFLSPVVKMTNLTAVFLYQTVPGRLTREQLLCVISTGLLSVRYRPDLLSSAAVQGEVQP